jgi:ribosomal protein L14E/L6E/L27E
MTLDMDKIVTKTVCEAKKVAKKASETANVAIVYTKNQIDRAAIRDQINEYYKKLGKLYYSEYSGSVSAAEIRACKEKLDELFIALKATDNGSAAIGCKVCGFCNAKNKFDNVYCAKCGEKL